jgi:hypothetical protein
LVIILMLDPRLGPIDADCYDESSGSTLE